MANGILIYDRGTYGEWNFKIAIVVPMANGISIFFYLGIRPQQIFIVQWRTGVRKNFT